MHSANNKQEKMKLKTRMRRWWRYSLAMPAIHGIFIESVLLILPPYTLRGKVALFAFLVLFICLFLEQRRSYIARRLLGLSAVSYNCIVCRYEKRHNAALKYIKQLLEDLLEAEKERSRLLKHIKDKETISE